MTEDRRRAEGGRERSKRERKREIREEVQRELAALEESHLGRASDRILDRLLSTTWWAEAEFVLTYLSTDREVSTDRMVEEACRSGKKVGVPCISGKHLIFFPVNPDSELTRNRYGIREPFRDQLPFDVSAIRGSTVLLVVPGVAFDELRCRLGRGGGYYDRYIRLLRGEPEVALTTVGVFFHLQMRRRLPVDPWDEPLDAVITERDIIG